MRKRQQRQEIPEAQFLGWIWKAAGLPSKKVPSRRVDFTAEHWDLLDAARPLAVPWSQAVLTQTALQVRKALWTLDRKSPIVDVMDAATRVGVAIVSEIELPGPKGLMVLYIGTDDNDIDVFDIDSSCNNCIVIPSWGVSCENVKLAKDVDEEETMV